MKLRPGPFALLTLILIAISALLLSQPAPPERVGPLPNGGFLLNNGWQLRPAGKQVPVETLPMSSVLSPDGKYLLVLNAGYNPPSISVLDTAQQSEVSRTLVPDAWLGLAISSKGDRVYVGGGSQAAVFEFRFAEGKLEAGRVFRSVPEDKRSPKDFIGDVTMSPDDRLIYAADLYHDSVLILNPQSGMVIERVKTGRRPYRILFHPDGKSFFVTSWSDGTLGHYQAETGAALEMIRVGPHPTDILWRNGGPPRSDDPDDAKEAGQASYVARLFVAAANTNNVYAIGISAGKQLRMVETINLAMTPQQPLGSTPSALALSPDQSRLYVVCSDTNSVAMADISGARSAVLGFIPTGWYPTAARTLRDGTLLVLNGRGDGSRPNPGGPNPARRAEVSHQGAPAIEYVGRIQTGTVSFIQPPDDAALRQYSETVLANSPYRDTRLTDAGAGNGPIPNAPGMTSPIEHVIYIVKENRSYDQVLGDMKEGNGDASLVLFGEQVTPNHHKLARDFVLLDNFYVNSDVSADGHSWSTAAIASDYVQKLWPNSYAGRRKMYDYEGQEPAALPPAGYLWTNAASAGLSLRNYGYFVSNRAQPGADGIQVDAVRDPTLRAMTNLRYRGFDLAYPDVDRARVFLADLATFDTAGQMPRLIILRLGNDHTSGTTPGRVAPLSAAADNDSALGMIVEGVSHSRFWPKTAIFVVEDDAQNGPDHVDSHRSPAFVISPYVRRKTIDHSMYNTTSMLRTMELILGMRPMTVFDAGSRPMSAAFQSNPGIEPYTAEKPRIDLDARNPASSLTAERSSRMDFDEEDRIDDNELNDILWTAIRGRSAPPPTRSYFAR